MSSAYNVERGSREFNIQKTCWRQEDLDVEKEWVTYLMSLCERIAKQGQRGIVNGQRKANKWHEVVNSHNYTYSKGICHIEDDIEIIMP